MYFAEGRKLLLDRTNLTRLFVQTGHSTTEHDKLKSRMIQFKSNTKDGTCAEKVRTFQFVDGTVDLDIKLLLLPTKIKCFVIVVTQSGHKQSLISGSLGRYGTLFAID